MASKNRESVKLNRPTKISGGWQETGDSVEVYPFQRRHLVDAGYVNGGLEDIASEGEKESGALEVLKPASKRNDIDGGVFSVDGAFAENDTGRSREPSGDKKS